MKSTEIFRLPFIVSSLLILTALSGHAAESAAEAAAAGAKVYARAGMCISCHQANGAGVPGAFPPLAGSDWVNGDPVAVIRMVEHGIEGEITVSGKNFNAIMPAQGGQLTDQDFANVLTYIRSAWGNKAGQVTKKQVTEQKKIDQDRGEKPWSANELKIQLRAASLGEPTVTVYPGTWSEIPALTTLPTPGAPLIGLLSSKQAPKEGGLLIADGVLTTKKDGQAMISLYGNGSTKAFIDDQLVVSLPSLLSGNEHPVVKQVGQVRLAPGKHRFRLIHLASADTAMNCMAAVNLPGFSNPIALTEGSAAPLARGESGLDLEPSVTKEPIIYRGIFALSSARSIAVGYPEKLSLIFDAINATWSMAWRGDFITCQHHWSGRGMDYEELPLGNQLALLPAEPAFAILANADAPWPARCNIDTWPDGYQFLGYDLDKAKRPTFRYRVGTAIVTDAPEPLADGSTLRRKLTITAEKALTGLTFRAIAGQNLVVVDPLTYRFDKRLTIHVNLPAGITPTVRTTQAVKEVLVPVVFTGTTAVISQDYHWEDAK